MSQQYLVPEEGRTIFSIFDSGSLFISSFMTHVLCPLKGVIQAIVEICEFSPGITWHHKVVPITITQVRDELRKILIMIHHSRGASLMNISWTVLESEALYALWKCFSKGNSTEVIYKETDTFSCTF